MSLPCLVLSCLLWSLQASCYSLGIVTFILGSLILLGIIVAINFTATQLRITLNNTPWTPSTPIQVSSQV